MRRAWFTAPMYGLLAGLLLLLAASGSPRAHASVVTSALHQEADTVPAAAPASDSPSLRDTLQEDVPSVVQLSAGLSAVTGVVVSGGRFQPVSSVLVSLKRRDRPEADGLLTETDDHGRFRFQGIPSGEYLLSTHHIGYRDRTDTVSVGHRALVNVDVPVTTEAVELPPIRVEVRSAWLARAGFYWRKERGLGRFMTPEEVRNRSAHNFSELMRGIQGIEVVRVCQGGQYPCERMLRMRQTNDFRACRVKYYMDGQPLTGQVYPDDISAHDIAAVEIYRNISETPAQFYGRCGSVVLWSKRFDPTARRQ